MVNCEIQSLLRKVVKVANNGRVEQCEVEAALAEVFKQYERDEEEAIVTMDEFKLQNEPLIGKIRNFVHNDMVQAMNEYPGGVQLYGELDYAFIESALLAYYKLAKENERVDTDRWLNLVAAETKLDAKTVSNLVKLMLKPYVAICFNMHWRNRRIDVIMRKFYQTHMVLW